MLIRLRNLVSCYLSLLKQQRLSKEHLMDTLLLNKVELGLEQHDEPISVISYENTTLDMKVLTIAFKNTIINEPRTLNGHSTYSYGYQKINSLDDPAV
ncbi:hypothetical protein ACHWQZ_G003447 [Mnemiopsis leidyi]